MKFAAAGLRLVFALVLAGSTTLDAAEPSPAPTKFRAHIGGFGGGNYVVEMRDDVITYTSRTKERG